MTQVMMKRAKLSLLAAFFILLVSACSQRNVDLPERVSDDPEAAQTALAASRPTLPPTFTPSATWTLEPSATQGEIGTVTPTLTLTLTLPPQPTLPSTLPPSATPTWTPDTQVQVRNTATPTPTSEEPAATNTPFFGCVIPQGAANLLQNAGFEGPSFTQQSEIQVPNGWVAFWVPEGTAVNWDPENTDGYRRPQIRVITKEAPFDNPLRVYAGNQALYIAGGNRAYDAGVYQQVTGVTVNERFCLNGWAHAWSAHQSDDRTQSMLANPQDVININFQLGIDPTGGTNAYASSVIWGSVANLYDDYAQIPGVEVRAQGTTITVFVRGWARWRFDHNDMWFDEIKLGKTG